MATSNNLFVDTAGWAYLVDRHETLHQDVRNIYNQAIQRRRPLLTTNYIISELVALLTSRSRIPRYQLFDYIDALKISPNIEIIHIDANLDSEAWKLLKARGDKAWSLVDASSFVIMHKYGIKEVLTSDHHFLQAGFTCLPVQ